MILQTLSGVDSAGVEFAFRRGQGVEIVAEPRQVGHPLVVVTGPGPGPGRYHLMNIILQYLDGCPNWETTREYLATLLGEGLDAAIDYELIDTYERAVERGIDGSPTVLVDRVGVLADRSAVPGVACRVYDSEQGPAGSPTLDQLRTAIGSARIAK